jgi:hypothetical protein
MRLPRLDRTTNHSRCVNCNSTDETAKESAFQHESDTIEYNKEYQYCSNGKGVRRIAAKAAKDIEALQGWNPTSETFSTLVLIVA